jgi:GDPmannose 4,6-dehydratase
MSSGKVAKAVITGVGGQDGTYLLELLLGKGYRIYGFDNDPTRLGKVRSYVDRNDLHDRVELELTDARTIDMRALLERFVPSEIYNLAAETRVDFSFRHPIETTTSIVTGLLNLLEAVRTVGVEARVYQASSSEMFGDTAGPQSEDSAFQPVSPYGSAKVDGHHLVRIYREAFGLHACAGILFNHESPRRPHDFVTRKITSGVAEIVAGRSTELRLGNLAARRDWGHARDYVRAMWLMLQNNEPRDYVVATGVSHTVEEFARLAFDLVGLDWREFVKHDEKFLRPTDPSDLCGDSARVRRDLGWAPVTDFEELVREMIESDLQA